MRKATITDMQGNALGSITENDSGDLSGEGKGQSLIDQAPGKSFDDWIETTSHSKYLKFSEEG